MVSVICPPQKNCMQMSSTGDHFSWLGRWPGLFSFGLRVPQGGSTNVVPSYLLYVQRGSKGR